MLSLQLRLLTLALAAWTRLLSTSSLGGEDVASARARSMRYLPLAGGVAGVGLGAFYYKQVTDDSGEGATLGAFRAKTVGLGPVLSYIRKLDGADLLVEFKWLHENDTQKRLKGDTYFLKAMLKF